MRKRVSLTLPLSYEPMNALLVGEIPEEPGWQYEPKWDGFRCLAHREGDRVEMQSKSGQPLARYFPEVVEALLALKAKRFVLDGELVIPDERGHLSFDTLLQRIHPAESRIRRLAEETPALFLVFDLLADERGRDLTGALIAERRRRLEEFMKKNAARSRVIRLSPATTDLKVAKRWFARVGAALDGIIAKRLDLPYQSGNRVGMVKVKQMRTADCVVGGFRYAAKAKARQVGSLLLGLYGDDGLLHHVGHTSSFTAQERPEITKKILPLRKPPGFTGRSPGGPSRWTGARSMEWEPLDPKLVVEVRYDHFSGGRFRHGSKIVRWRPDKAPRQCTMDQVEREAGVPVLELVKS